MRYPARTRYLAPWTGYDLQTAGLGHLLGTFSVCVEWLTTVRETSHQLIVYHPPSHAIQVVPHPDRSALDDDTEEESSPTYVDADSMPVDITTSSATGCPLCGRAWAASAHGLEQMEQEEEVSPEQAGQGHYFRVLEKAHEFSRPGTPLPNTDGYLGSSPARTPVHSPNDYIEEADLPAKGYYERFFKEDSRLGIGAEGSVYLATHVISGSELGMQPCEVACTLTDQGDTLLRRLQLAIPRPTWSECYAKYVFSSRSATQTLFLTIIPGWTRRGFHPLGLRFSPFTS